MQITIEYLVQFLGELLKYKCPAEEKVRLVESFHHAAQNHLPKQNGLTEKKVGNEKEKNQKKKKGSEKKEWLRKKRKKDFRYG